MRNRLVQIPIIFIILLLSLPLFSKDVQSVDDPIYSKKDRNSKYLSENMPLSTPLGVVVGLEYKSTNVWRGTLPYAQKEGILLPFARYINPTATFGITIQGELASETFGEGGKVLEDFRQYHSANFGINGATIVDESLEFGYAFWFNYRFLSDREVNHNSSFSSIIGYFIIGSLPLKPKLSYSHDIYFDENAIVGKNLVSDFYIELSLYEDFNINKNAFFGFGLSTAYYNNITRKRQGFNHISALIKLTVNIDRITTYVSNNFSVVTDGGFKKNFNLTTDIVESDIYRWWIEFGVKYSL